MARRLFILRAAQHCTSGTADCAANRSAFKSVAVLMANNAAEKCACYCTTDAASFRIRGLSCAGTAH
jgi:hypothetical protein